jgi:hypothetical protein
MDVIRIFRLVSEAESGIDLAGEIPRFFLHIVGRQLFFVAFQLTFNR